MRCLMFIKHPESDRDKVAPASLYTAMEKFVTGECEVRPVEG